jgi:glycosyltransferase involved in cell wall biosynthesis
MIPWKETRKAFLKSFWNSACRVLLGSAPVGHPRRVRTRSNERAHGDGRRAYQGHCVRDRYPHASRAERPRGHALHLLFVGRLDPIKGLDNLLKALTIESARSATLSICGTGDAGYAASLRKMAMTLGVASRVRFEGHVDDARKEAQFAAADALVLPSHTENFGLVVAEALAHGVPVIASKGTPWSAVESEGCGLWVDNSPESLARAISALHSMDLRPWAAKGRRWVGGRFSWPAIARGNGRHL